MLTIEEYSETEIAQRLKDLRFTSLDERSMFFNYLHTHGGVAAIDIDGVLCEEGGEIETRKKIRDIPKTSCKYTVLYTARLEQDRAITESWLKVNNISYDALVMNKLPYTELIDDRARNIVK